MRSIVIAAIISVLSITLSYAREPDDQSAKSQMEKFQADLKNAAALSDLTHVKEHGSVVVGTVSGAQTKALGITTNDLRSCGMVWNRDESGYSVWRPTRPTAIVVNLVRNGKLVGSNTITVRPPSQEISLLMNLDGLNHDGVQSCNITL